MTKTQIGFTVTIAAIGTVLLASLLMAKGWHERPVMAEQSRVVKVFEEITTPKGDRADVEPKPIRVIPIVAQDRPKTPTEVLAKVATALPAEPVAEAKGPLPEAVVPGPEPKPHDICAAHGMQKVERGRGWRCVHVGRR